mmetsp:Transcript_4115/g.11321  ORF Transcript_4115/g.11321 Transcript_4115/m.11321 type:complete len:228 (+) Transcript_4115:1089-1772(+)
MLLPPMLPVPPGGGKEGVRGKWPANDARGSAENRGRIDNGLKGRQEGDVRSVRGELEGQGGRECQEQRRDGKGQGSPEGGGVRLVRKESAPALPHGGGQVDILLPKVLRGGKAPARIQRPGGGVRAGGGRLPEVWCRRSRAVPADQVTAAGREAERPVRRELEASLRRVGVGPAPPEAQGGRFLAGRPHKSCRGGRGAVRGRQLADAVHPLSQGRDRKTESAFKAQQ